MLYTPARKRRIVEADQRDLGRPVPSQKIFRLTRRANQWQHSRRPVPQRGVSRSSRTRGGMRWTQAALLTRARTCGRRSRVVLTPRRWRQVGGSTSAGDGGKKARSPVGHRGEHEVTVKTIAQGRLGSSGEPVVTMLVWFFYSHARLRVRRAPGFPCALYFHGRMISGKARAPRAAGMRAHILNPSS